MVHDKSSLAPEGKTVAFNLGNEEGFYWLDGYGDITAEEMLLKLFIEANKPKVEKAIKTAVQNSEKAMSHSA